ncbi:OmpH family outer membrane protein [Sphingomicrobium sp. XHP0239]|uniref:OmpH family outer membrane protein n=1 Tax=Sphingomicrobium maritimum TaxID=3133972 RepID=UPI0031CCAD46
MKNLVIAAGFAAAATLAPQAASAQALPDAKIGVVDVERVISTCNACVTANTQLQQQVQAVQARQNELATPLQAEGQALNTALQALNGAQPDAALQQRAQAFEQQRNTIAREIQQRSAVVDRNRNFVLQQIATALEPAYTQVLNTRRATIIVPLNSTLANAPAVDVTTDVLNELNRTLTTINVNAPAPQQPAQQPAATPQGR